jgi:DNA-binding XRE family transcriptional regulator
MPRESDFLDEIVAERLAKDQGFEALVDAALDRRRMLRRLAEDRLRLGLSQTAVAAAMGTSQSAVARIESAKADLKLSTLERYAATLGRKIEWRLANSKPRLGMASARGRGGESPLRSPGSLTARKISRP